MGRTQNAVWKDHEPTRIDAILRECAMTIRERIRVKSQVMQQAGVSRSELSEKRLPSRSAREQADAIRERLTQPRATWAASTLF